MRIVTGRAAEQTVRKLELRRSQLARVEPSVKKMISTVRRRGDEAVLEYATAWDDLPAKQPLRLPPEQIAAAWDATPHPLRSGLKQAAANIRRFCKWQMPREWTRKIDGGALGQLVRPLNSVGCYVPGGRYPLPSTLLMTAIPAQVAGVQRIVVTSPRPQTATLAAAALLGISEVYRCGGAHAVAMLAYGTKTVPPVDKIVGPGNAYVTAAKKLVSADCLIDMLAGPTEAVVFCDEGEIMFLASDLVAQAEHDPDALVIHITLKRALAEEMKDLVNLLSRGNPIARQVIGSNAFVLLARSRSQALEWVNRLAPEHLTISQADLDLVQNAGSVFIGDCSPQAAGDYAAGPNHVLPTAGAARFRGGLSVHDFLKVITVQKFDRNGLERIAPAVTTLAQAEGLIAHAQSMRLRCGNA